MTVTLDNPRVGLQVLQEGAEEVDLLRVLLAEVRVQIFCAELLRQ